MFMAADILQSIRCLITGDIKVLATLRRLETGTLYPPDFHRDHEFYGQFVCFYYSHLGPILSKLGSYENLSYEHKESVIHEHRTD